MSAYNRDDTTAWWLPGLSEWDGPSLDGATPGGVAFTTPRLDARTAARVARDVRKAAVRARAERSLEEVVQAVSAAALRLAASEGGARESGAELLARGLGWPADLARETLSRMAEGWSRPALLEIIRSELGDPGLLEEFRREERDPEKRTAARGRRRRAVGPSLLLVVHAGNVPGVAVTAAIRGLLARSGVLCKAPEREPLLLARFARELDREDPLLAASFATTWWPGGGGGEAREEWAKHAGKVVVYGGEETVTTYRAHLPSGSDLVAYGPRLGLGVVLPDVAGDVAGDRGRSAGGGSAGSLEEAARGLARDVCAYEQQGCVSPRLVYVVGGDPLAFARHLGDAMEEEIRRLPRPRPEPAEAVALRRLRDEAEFRAYAAEAAREADSEGGPEGEPPTVLISSGDLTWTILVGGDSLLQTEALPRVVRVHGVEDLASLERLLRPLEGRIQALGYAGGAGVEELAETASRLGVSRMAPMGRVAWPPPDWRHDGRHQLLPLLRWTDWE